MSIIRRFIDNRFMKPAHDMRASQFAELTPEPGGVAFLGDSITAGGLWHEWFPLQKVVNRGIDGDTTTGLLARLDSAVTGPPARVFLLIGTNDLTWGESPEDIASRTAEILDRIRAKTPTATLYVQSVMPRTPKLKARIERLNDRYEQLARERDLVYIDLWPVSADAEGGLRAAYTLDRLHLTGAGYRAWADALHGYLA